jgi:hypothetical protein
MNPNLGNDRVPQMGPSFEHVQYQPFLKQQEFILRRDIVIEKDSEYAAGSPVTLLVPGLIMVRIETGTHKGKYVPAGHADAPAAGSVVQAGILELPVRMVKKDGSGDVEDQQGVIVIGGVIDEDALVTDDTDYVAAAKEALTLCHFIAAPA